MNEYQNIVSQILEHQKCIVINKQFIRELDKQGTDTSKLKNEIEKLEKKIVELKVKSELVF